MTALFSDTHPKMEALQIQLWRQASPTRKMNMLAPICSEERNKLFENNNLDFYPQKG